MGLDCRGFGVKVALCAISFFTFHLRTYGVRTFEPVLHGNEGYNHLRLLKQLESKDIFTTFDDKTWSPFGQPDQTKDITLVRLVQIFKRLSGILVKELSADEACIYFGPFCAAVTPWICFMVTKTLLNDTLSSICASFFISILPGYTFASVAGRLSSEALVPMMIILFIHCWSKGVKSGCLAHVSICALVYAISSSLWANSFFMTNFVAIYVVLQILRGQYNRHLYHSFSIFYALSMCLTLSNLDFLSSEQFLPLVAFLYLQFYSLSINVGNNDDLRAPINASFTSTIILLCYMKYAEIISPLSEDNAIYLNPSLPKTSAPVLATSSSAQPSAWGALFFDNHYGAMFLPIGLTIISRKDPEVSMVYTVYSFMALYLAAVKTSNQILLVPIVAITSATVICRVLQLSMNIFVKEDVPEGLTKKQKIKYDQEKDSFPFKRLFGGAAGALSIVHLIYAARHGAWVAKEVYSDPTLFLTAHQAGDGQTLIFDDFRESYSWLKHNTPEDSKIVAWWDYGYQINSMAERATMVDNSGWNKTQIAQVGRIFASQEAEAYEMLRKMNADYIYVTFGGQVNFSKDDIGKFLWMLRIADSETSSNEFKQKRYKNENNEFRVDIEGSQTWLNSLLYKLSYYRYGALQVDNGRPTGWDRVRRAEIGNKDFEMEYFEEAYTSNRWLVRIYRVKKPEEISISWY